MLLNTYKRQPVAFTHGKGVWLTDTHGKTYLDALGGVAVNALGHAHPAFVAAVSDQVGKLTHCSNIYNIPLQTQLAEKICQLSGMDAVFFANSGAEANEGAIKIARLFGHNKGIAEPKIAVMTSSFHGRTLSALAATGNLKIQAGFAPLPTGFVRVP